MSLRARATGFGQVFRNGSTSSAGQNGRKEGSPANRRQESASAASNAAHDEVEVVSYNVLSSHLSQTSYFWHNDPEDLKPQSRLQRLTSKMEPFMDRGAVICLQECSTTWAGYLHVFFQKRDYYFIYSPYGRQFNGYMGVGIAFPNQRYEAYAVQIQRVADVKGWPDAPRPDAVKGRSVLHTLLDFAGYFGSPSLLEGKGPLDPEREDDEKVLEEVDPWEYSRSRQNTMVSVMLRPKVGDLKDLFAVSTYHMPCAYWAPKVMVIHAALAAQCAHKFANGHPLILAGDWNFKPGAAPYQLLTNASLPEDHPAHPGYQPGVEWRLETGLREMRSVYAERNPGGEPEFTNYAWVQDDTDPFIGTLDYIFVSDAAEVLSVGKLPPIRVCPNPLPTRDEPSDHLLISAVLRPYGRAKPNAKRRSSSSATRLTRVGTLQANGTAGGREGGGLATILSGDNAQRGSNRAPRERGFGGGFGSRRGKLPFSSSRPTSDARST